MFFRKKGTLADFFPNMGAPVGGGIHRNVQYGSSMSKTLLRDISPLQRISTFRRGSQFNGQLSANH